VRQYCREHEGVPQGVDLGFDLYIRLRDDLDSQRIAETVAELCEMIHAKGMRFFEAQPFYQLLDDGSKRPLPRDHRRSGFIRKCGSGSLSDEDRAAIEDLLLQHPLVESFEKEHLCPSWHFFDDPVEQYF